MEEEELVADIDEATESENDYLNDVLTESQYMDDHSQDLADEDGFERNKEGVTGDEWETEAKKKAKEELDAEVAKEKEEEDAKQRNKRNAERRLANKARKNKANEEATEAGEEDQEQRLEDDQLDSAELSAVKEQMGHYETMIQEAAPFMDMLVRNKMDQESLQLGIDFVNNWKTDKIGTVKRLLTSLQNSGIDVGQILTHDDREMQIRGEVDKRMQPMYSQQQQANAQMRAQNELERFLSKYPDANAHLEEITQVLRKLGSTNLEDAYFRMRRAYRDNNKSWFGDEADEMIEEEVMNAQPSVASPNIGGFQPQRAPTSTRDLIRQNTHNYFNRR